MNLQRTRDLVSNEGTAVKIIASKLIDIAMEHKKKALVFIIIELWVHSLSFQHLHELKSMWDLIPFIH